MTCKYSASLSTRLRNRSGCTGRCRRWCRKPQQLVYQLCAEDITKGALVPHLPEAERHLLLVEGALPPESSARGRTCVMCPVKGGSPKLIPCCLCNNWCHVPCSYQTHLRRVCPCHVRILDPKRKIMVTSHPYIEDYVVSQPGKQLEQKTEWLVMISATSCPAMITPLPGGARPLGLTFS